MFHFYGSIRCKPKGGKWRVTSCYTKDSDYLSAMRHMVEKIFSELLLFGPIDQKDNDNLTVTIIVNPVDHHAAVKKASRGKSNIQIVNMVRAVIADASSEMHESLACTMHFDYSISGSLIPGDKLAVDPNADSPSQAKPDETRPKEGE